MCEFEGDSCLCGSVEWTAMTSWSEVELISVDSVAGEEPSGVRDERVSVTTAAQHCHTVLSSGRR